MEFSSIKYFPNDNGVTAFAAIVEIHSISFVNLSPSIRKHEDCMFGNVVTLRLNTFNFIPSLSRSSPTKTNLMAFDGKTTFSSFFSSSISF